MKSLFTAFLFVIPAFAYAQVPPVEWQFNLDVDFEDWVESVVKTSDNGYLIAGVSNPESTIPSFTYHVMKVNATGNLVWHKVFADGQWEHAHPIELVNNGGYIINTEGSKLIRLDPATGNTVWQKNIVGSGTAAPAKMIATSDEGFISVFASSEPAGGDKSAPNLGGVDYWLLKLTKNNAKVWDKTFGGTANDFPNDICARVRADGFIINGYSASGASGNKTETETGPWAVQVDLNGNKVEDSYTSGAWKVQVHPSSIFTLDDGNPVSKLEPASALPSSPFDFQYYLYTSARNIGGISWGRSFPSDIFDVFAQTDGTVIVSTFDSLYKLDYRFQLIWQTAQFKGRHVYVDKEGTMLFYGANDFAVTKTKTPVLSCYNALYKMGTNIFVDGTDIWDKKAQFVDYNKDGTLEVAASYFEQYFRDIGDYRYVSSEQIIGNTGELSHAGYDNRFTVTLPFNFTVLDYDNSGNYDISANEVMKEITSTGGMIVTGTTLPAIKDAKYSHIAWGDLDNNGLADAFLPDNGIYWQDTVKKFTKLSSFIGLDIYKPHLYDVDKNGFLDIISGRDIYLNNNFAFTKQTNKLLYNIAFPVELNGDGFIDFIVYDGGYYPSPQAIFPFYTAINDGTMNFTYKLLDSRQIMSSGDFNNDGLTDLIGEKGGHYFVHLNQGGGNFAFNKEYVVNGTDDSPEIMAADLDNDGDLDFASLDSYQLLYFRNNQGTPNQKPSVPTAMKSSRSGNTTTLEWNASTDNTTPAAALTYNVYIMRGSKIIASSNSIISSGKRTLINTGNAGLNRLFKITNLPVGTYTWGVQAIDKSFEPSAFSAIQTFYVTNNPTNITLSGTTNIPENSTAAIGTFSTTDQDTGETFTYSLTSGTGSTDNALFKITTASLSAASATSLNFESKASYSIRVRSTDSRQGTFEKVFTITVTNVQEAATDIGPATLTLAENKSAGTEIATLTSNDPDAGDNHLFTLVAGTGSTDNAKFEIVSNKLRSKEPFDFETRSSYAILIQTDDQKAETAPFKKAVTVTVTNANDVPGNINLSSTAIEEGKPIATTIGFLTGEDQDAGETFTYSLVPGFQNNNSFIIVGDELRSGEVFTRSIKASYAIKVRITDSKAGSFEKEFTITINPTSVALVITPDYNVQSTLKYAMGNASQPMTVTVTGGKAPYSVTLVYKAISGGNEKTIEATQQVSDKYAAAIKLEDINTDPFGIEFYVKVADANLLTKQTQPALLYKSFEAGALNVPITRFGGTLNTYQIISIPLELVNPSVANMFGPTLGGADKTKWRLIEYKDSQYIDFGGKLVNLELGKGYWFNARESVSIKPTAGTVATVTSGSPFAMNLSAGWNLIGNPYPFDLDWDDVLDANPGSLTGNLNVYNQDGARYEISNTLKQWSGGFVFTDNTTSLIFPVTLKGSSGGRKADPTPENSEINKEDWIVPLTLKAGEIESAYSGVGMNTLANLSKDRYDRISLPHFDQYIEFKTTHDEYFYPDFSMDVVPTQSEYVWDFVFENTMGTNGAEIRWNNKALGTNNAHLTLHDLETERLINMKETGSYQFIQSGTQHRFKIHFSIESNDILPEKTMLGKAYPNPLKDDTTIPLRLSSTNKSYYVSIAVYDMLGKTVNSLINHELTAGFHDISWDGKNFTGEDLPNGIYIYHLFIDGKNTHQLNRLAIDK